MAIKHLTKYRETAGRPYTGRNGMYSHVKATAAGAKVLTNISRELKLPAGLDRQMKLHCTVMWSKVAPHTPRAANYAFRGVATIDRLDFWKGHDSQGYVVAILNSPDLQKLHNEWGERGCSHSFADYTPHVTLADDLGLTAELSWRLNEVAAKYKGQVIDFLGEYLEDLKA